MNVLTPVPRLPSLTGIRFPLAMAVTVCHMAYVSGVFTGPVRGVLSVTEPLATSAVTGFFVLSGFVMTWAHRPGDRPREFYRRRFWKIFPNHVLGWTLAVGFFALATADPPLIMPTGDSPGAGLANLLLVQNWVPDADVFFSFNTPAWSISCEAFFYALFPALLVLARKIPVHQLRPAWAAVVLLILVLPLVSSVITGPVLYDWLPINENSLWFIYVLPPVRLPEFVLGIVTARLLQTGGLPRPTRAWLCLPPLAALAAVPLLPSQYALGTMTAAPMALVIAHLTLKDTENRSGVLARPAMVALGDSSYALYIIHFPLLLIARQLLGTESTFTPGAGLLLVLGLIVLSMGTAWTVHRYFEQPLTRAFSRRTPLPQARGAAAPTSLGSPREASATETRSDR